MHIGKWCGVDPFGVQFLFLVFPVRVVGAPASVFLGGFVAEPVMTVFILGSILLHVDSTGFDIWAICVEVVFAATLVAFAVLSVPLAPVDVGAKGHWQFLMCRPCWMLVVNQ